MSFLMNSIKIVGIIARPFAKMVEWRNKAYYTTQ